MSTVRRESEKCWPSVVLCLFFLTSSLAFSISTLESPRVAASSLPLNLSGGSHFAIADLDGDHHPDIATVEVDTSHWATSSYLIHLDLTNGPRAVFGVRGPSGGIRVLAKDVNGDDRVDLVVASIAEDKVLAVLLNEGNGQFSVAEPAVDATVSREPDRFFRAANGSCTGTDSVFFSRQSFGVERLRSAATPLLVARGATWAFTVEQRSQGLARPSRGRSPPFGVVFT